MLRRPAMVAKSIAGRCAERSMSHIGRSVLGERCSGFRGCRAWPCEAGPWRRGQLPTSGSAAHRCAAPTRPCR